MVTPDNFRAFSLPIMIRDPRTTVMVATVDGADVSPLQAKRGQGGAIRIGMGNGANHTAYAGYLSGWLRVDATVQGGGPARPYAPKLPASSGPVASYNGALELLRRTGAIAGASRGLP
jgi:hypothetical protein